MKILKNLLTSSLLLLGVTAFAQPVDVTQPYYVTTTDDTVMCDVIKIKSEAITCQIGAKKTEMRNEFIRRMYIPVDESPFDVYFKAYAEKGTSRLYPYGPKTTAKVLAKGKFPRFFDLKPLDVEKNFWGRGLFEILAQNNGYKLCKIRISKGATPSFATTGDSNPDKYFIFEENEATGIELTKNNFAREILKITGDCPKAKQALSNPEINVMKDLPAFLAIYAECK